MKRPSLCYLLLSVSLLNMKFSLSHNTDFKCSKYPTLTTGIMCMGSLTTSSTARTIQVKRGNTLLTSGAAYVAGESLTVSLSSSSGEVILESSGGASFQSGSCTGAKRYYGTSRTLVMPSTNLGTVEVWGGWATGQSTVYITNHFTLSPPLTVPTLTPSASPSKTPTVIPTRAPTKVGDTQSPSSVPTSAPQRRPTPAPVDDSLSYSVSVTAATTGQTANSLQAQILVIENTICSHINLNPSLCLVSFVGPASPAGTVSDPVALSPQSNTEKLGSVSDYDFLTQRPTGQPGDNAREGRGGGSRGDGDVIYPPNSILFTVLIDKFLSSTDASSALATLETFLNDQTLSGFRSEFSTASGLTLSTVSFSAGVVTDTTSSANSRLGYSCDLSHSLKLSWEVVSDGDGVSTGAAGGYVRMSLRMLKAPAEAPWFSGGVVTEGTVNMDRSSAGSANVVYFYDPTEQVTGEYTINGYDSSDIVRDTRRRVDSGLLGTSTASDSISIDMQRSRFTGISSDPELMMTDAAGFNSFIWAHGGIWPEAHTSANRGFTDVYWAQGSCRATAEPEHTSWKIFLSLLLGLIVTAAFFVRLRLMPQQGFKIASSFIHGGIGSFVCLPKFLPSEIISLPLSSLSMCILFLVIVLIYIELTTSFYINTRGYDTDRAYASSTGYAALFLVAITTLPVNKTSIWLRVLHVPYDRATKFHRWCAMLTVTLSTVHLLLMVKFWDSSNVLIIDTSKQIGVAFPAFGFIAIIFFWAMSLTSIYAIRSRLYELFQFIHLLFFPALILIIFHYPEWGLRVLICPLALYVIDFSLRFSQQFQYATVASASLPLPDYVVLKIEIKNTQNIQPGNYYFLNIPDASYFQWHPISISECDKNLNQMTFVIKNVGNWTKTVCSLDWHHAKFMPKVRMYGPYGKFRVDLDCNSTKALEYKTIILISGGIGLTPMLSTLDWLLDKIEGKDFADFKALKIIFIVTVRDLDMLHIFGKQFNRYQKNSSFVDIQLFCTRNKVQKSNCSFEQITVSIAGSFPCALNKTRPNFSEIICTACNVLGNKNDKLAVLVCGPDGMIKEVQDACKVAQTRYGRVTVDLHEESFCF